jgi:hypothetical protein
VASGALFIMYDWDPSGMIATIRAEDAFDVGERLQRFAEELTSLESHIVLRAISPQRKQKADKLKC